MIFKNARFWLHRQLFCGFIAISCLLITAEFETTDGTFKSLCLKLYSFDEFVDYIRGKSSLDKPMLESVANRLRDDAKHRRDYLQLKLRPVKWDECATEDDLTWPLLKADQDKFSSGSQWENSFATSRFASNSIFNWVDGDFLMSAMTFPLRSVQPYSLMYFYSQKCRVEQQFIYINLRDGDGYVQQFDYAKYLNRATIVTLDKVTAGLIAVVQSNKRLLSDVDYTEPILGDSSMTMRGNINDSAKPSTKRRRPILLPMHDPVIKPK